MADLFQPNDRDLSTAQLTEPEYREQYRQSIENPESFYADIARKQLEWMTDFNEVYSGDFAKGEVQWFRGGKLNASTNCLDRHLPEHSDRKAIIWESDDATETRTLTYSELHAEVGKMAQVLKVRGVQKGDRVCIYMPMIPEAVVAMLACARIGAVHSVVFGGFSPDSIADRVLDAECSVIITADGGRRSGKVLALKENVDLAIASVDFVHTVLVVQHIGGDFDVGWTLKRDCWYHEMVERLEQTDCTPESMDSEDPLFILYTSGSTGKPKGVLHTTAGYLLNATLTYDYLFAGKDLDKDIFWCTADVGWITGHTYIVYGPLSNGATVFMFEGVPTYPDASRCWDCIDRHDISVFFTAPTAIRSLMQAGDSWVTKHDRSSLRLLGTVGEPINPEVWKWYHQVVGDGRCSIVDTWWQTETGAAMITPIPGITPMKPGSATLPFLGVHPVLLTPEGQEIEGEGEGLLAIKQSWPSQVRTVYGSHELLLKNYFNAYPGYYLTGDGAKRDKDGYWWITGRVDDVLNISGHRLGTAEIESAIVAHPQVAEAAVVGYPHDIKGQGIYAYVILIGDNQPTPELEREVIAKVAQIISPIAKPDIIQWVPALPKTRSGKIMRRILRKIAEGQPDQLGDITTLADPTIVAGIVEESERIRTD